MKCVACDAPLDDDIDLCDECFRVMPMDRVMSPSEIREWAAFVKTLERVSLDPPGPTGKTKMVLPPPDIQQVVTYTRRDTP